MHCRLADEAQVADLAWEISIKTNPRHFRETIRHDRHIVKDANHKAFCKDGTEIFYRATLSHTSETSFNFASLQPLPQACSYIANFVAALT